jgi:hypothetical protein
MGHGFFASGFGEVAPGGILGRRWVDGASPSTKDASGCPDRSTAFGGELEAGCAIGVGRLPAVGAANVCVREIGSGRLPVARGDWVAARRLRSGTPAGFGASIVGTMPEFADVL